MAEDDKQGQHGHQGHQGQGHGHQPGKEAAAAARPAEPAPKEKGAVSGEPKEKAAPKALHPDVVKAKEAYDGSLARLKKAIEDKKTARDAKSADPKNEELKKAYEEAHKEHTDALVEIRTTRPKFKELRDKHAAAPAEKEPAKT